MALDLENKRRAIMYVPAVPNNNDLETEDQRRHFIPTYENPSAGGPLALEGGQFMSVAIKIGLGLQ